MNFILVLFGVTFLTTYCYGYNIFGIFPSASFSHQQPMLALSRALAAKGHNLTVITTNPSKKQIKNHREIDISFLYNHWEPFTKQTQVSLQKRLDAFGMLDFIALYNDYFTSRLLDSPQIKDLIREINGTRYDLILYESLNYGSLLGFGQMIGNPPVIGLITMQPVVVTELKMGNPIITSYMPNPHLPYGTDMNLWERIVNLAVYLYSIYLEDFYNRPSQNRLLRKHFGLVETTTEELETNKSLLLAAYDFELYHPRPTQPNTILVGTLHVEEPNPLDQDLKQWMDSAEDGVIYFSLGSNVKGTSVPDEKRKAFIEAFERFPNVRVLWKWEADTKLPGQPDNVLVKKWLPQQSVLAHPKMRLFISQCGLQSTQEAMHYAVPMLCIPMFGDQHSNARALMKTGVGLKVEFDDINFDAVYGNLNSILLNTSYKENMAKLSNLIKDKPMSSMETAIWWVEYVVRNKGAPHLRPASLNLTTVQYYMLDVLALLLTIAFALFYTTHYIINNIILASVKSKKLKKM